MHRKSRIGFAPLCSGRTAGALREVVRHPAMMPTFLGAGIVLSLISSAVVRHWERSMAGEKASDIVHEQLDRLQEKGTRSMEVLYSVASLYEAHGGISRAEFQEFVQQALARQPELRALEWSPRVVASERRQFEATARHEGVVDFQIRERGPNGQLVASGVHSEYIPLYFVEPLAGNAAALGYDLASDPSRRQTLEMARDADQPAATAPIQLVQENDRQPGFLVLLPIYRGPIPKTTAARREKLAGFAVAVFRVSDLVGAAFGELESKGIQARLFDESTSGELIYPAAASVRPEDFPGSAPQVAMDVAGRRWVVQFHASPTFQAAQPHQQSLLVLIGGLGFTSLITAHLYNGWRRTRQIAAANALLQKEVLVRQKAEAAAAAANQAKSDFLASMSHEIRTPLNAILGYTQLMQRDPTLSPEQWDAIAGISASGQHLIGLINEILDLSKIEAGRMQINSVDFDLNQLGRGLLATFQPLCAQKKITLRLVAETSQPTRVMGDEGKLRQVLINLIGNAVKFTSVGEVFLGIKAAPEGCWSFEVVDTGPGIPAEEHEDIFKPFHQGSNAAHQGGTGLGLAIARRQVELLGGELALQSERGLGSRFYFQIPLPGAFGLETPDPLRRQPHLKPGCQVRVLVVDDRKENREVLGGLLVLAGCAVSYASNGQDSLLLARTLHHDLVFMDLLMPGLDGVATARSMLSDPACGFLKIIAHSAAALPRHREQACAAGCVDFLAKPIPAEEVYRCLQNHLGVEFDYADLSPARETLPPWAAGQVRLPGDLLDRLTTAAELHSTTTLKLCLQELRQIQPEGSLLAEHIRHLMRSYDMDGVLRLICQVTTPILPAPSPSPSHGLASS
jgi:signal transduction histidine kinase/CheY-like chemotaxis protein